MLKIVIDGRESGTSTGRYVDKLLEYLHKLKPDFEIVVLTKPQRLDFLKQLTPNFEIVESNYKEFGFAEQFGLARQIYKLKADLVHFTMIQQPVWYHGMVVTTIHDLTTARFKNPAKNSLIFNFKQVVYRWVIKRVAKKSQTVITPSQFVKNDVAGFTNISPDKIAVTYEAADQVAQPAEPMNQLLGKEFLLYAGRPTPHKNLERALQAFSLVKQTRPGLQFVLAGKLDDNYRNLQKVAEKKAIEGLVFTDFISDGQLRWLYESAKLYVFASLSEGFGLPGLEAMVHGLPVASSNATCLPEIYGDAAFYFDPLDASDMAAKIEQVLNDKELRQQLIAKGRKQAQRYSWQKMASQTLEVYQKALNT